MKRKKLLTILLVALILALIPAGYVGLRYYKLLMSSNTNTGSNNARYLYVPTGSDFQTLIDSLTANNFLVNTERFINAAKFMDFEKVRAGRYRITNGMSNRSLIRMLSLGNQSPVRLTLAGNIRTKDKLASIVSRYIEPDSLSLIRCFNDDNFLAQHGLNASNMLAVCLLNTYEFYWNTTPEGFVERMLKESNRFWNAEREGKRAQTPWSRMEIATLASIVAEETLKADEMPRVAGVYINRLNSNMPLQADPTVKYAVGDFSLRRVLNKHTEYDSPYNTYKYAGLPPGPICVPSATAIDAVLNAEKHEYYYFCAKADFSGYHSFAKTLEQHNKNAQSYQAMLNKNRIYR